MDTIKMPQGSALDFFRWFLKAAGLDEKKIFERGQPGPEFYAILNDTTVGKELWKGCDWISIWFDFDANGNLFEVEAVD